MLTRFTYASTHVIRRHINFPRTQREPSDIPAEATRPSTDEDNQRGRVNRLHCDRPGHPAPASPDTHPASVMKWRIAPGRVINPRPSPGSNPIPVARMIRRPPGRHLVGKPDVAVVRIVAPVALIIQVVITDHIARHVLCGTRKIITVIAILGPVIEVIEARNRFDIGVKLVGSAERSSLPGVQIVALPAASGLAFANADVYRSTISVRTRPPRDTGRAGKR